MRAECAGHCGCSSELRAVISTKTARQESQKIAIAMLGLHTGVDCDCKAGQRYAHDASLCSTSDGRAMSAGQTAPSGQLAENHAIAFS